MDAVRYLSISIGTYSDQKIGKVGLYRYAQDPVFTTLLFAYSLDGSPVQVVDLTQPEARLPAEVIRWLFDLTCIKHAYNAAFEWYCLSRLFRLEADASHPPEKWLLQWRRTMLHGLYCGYTTGLDATGEALGLPQDKQKLAAGKVLIRYFCAPCKSTESNGGRIRNLPRHDPAKWELFEDYCKQDVVTEMKIERRPSDFPVPDCVQAQWVTDQDINTRGVAVDMQLVTRALQLDTQTQQDYVAEAVALTGLDNPNSVAQLSRWLQEEIGEEVADLRKDTAADLQGKELPGNKARRVLEVRRELGKTSNKKYTVLAHVVCADNWVRGLLQFYGANRTGRWAGRIVQPQNLPRAYMDGTLLPLARDLVERQDAAGLRVVFGLVLDALSQLIRTAFVAAPGRTLADVDFSAIEARVVAWLAGEEWVLEVFRTHGRIYEATTSQLYGVPMERIKKGNPEYSLRQYGKVATLALGHAGSAPALITAGHLPKDIPEDELIDIRDRWRNANPAIVQFWYIVEAAAREAMKHGRRVELDRGRLVFAYEMDANSDFLTIQLSNDHKLYYTHPHMGVNRFGRPVVCHRGANQKSHKWEVIETYGGRLTENITQAAARDCLVEAVERLEATGYSVAFHIHDEVVIDTPPGRDSLEEVINIMRQVPSWAEGLPLNADGWANLFFEKDQETQIYADIVMSMKEKLS